MDASIIMFEKLRPIAKESVKDPDMCDCVKNLVIKFINFITEAWWYNWRCLAWDYGRSQILVIDESIGSLYWGSRIKGYSLSFPFHII